MGEGWYYDFKHTHFDTYSPPDFYARVSCHWKIHLVPLTAMPPNCLGSIPRVFSLKETTILHIPPGIHLTKPLNNAC